MTARFFWCVVAPLAVNAVIFFFLLWKAKSHFVVRLEYLSMVLSAATVVLTGVAIVVAILAVFGYREIRDRTEDAAIKKVEEMLPGAVIEAATPQVAQLIEEALGARGYGEPRGDDVAQASKEDA